MNATGDFASSPTDAAQGSYIVNQGQGLGQVAALLAPAPAVDGLVDDHAAGERTAYPPVGTSALVEQTTQHTEG